MQPSYWRIFRLVLFAVMSLLVLAVCAQLAALIITDPRRAAPVAFFAAFLLLTPVGLWLIVVTGARRRRAMILLTYVEQAVRLNLPLPRIIQSLSQTRGAGGDPILDQMRDLLERGEPLAVALSLVPQIPPRVLRLIAGAERTGRLPQVLARLIEEQRQARLRRLSWPRFHSAYPLVLALFLVTVTFMLMVFVVPKFVQIMSDFGTELPWVSQVTLSVARFVGPGGTVLLLMVLGLSLIAQFAFGSAPLRQLFTETIPQRMLGIVPLLGELRARRAIGDLLTYIGDATETGRPLDATLAEASEVTANTRARQMMADWAQGLLRGLPVAEAARDARLPRLVVGMLATTAKSPDSAAVMRFLGRYYSMRFSRAMALLEAATVPACAIVMGSIVAWIALSMFLPIIRLIDVCSPYPRGF